jgi:hypothetical protein
VRGREDPDFQAIECRLDLLPGNAHSRKNSHRQQLVGVTLVVAREVTAKPRKAATLLAAPLATTGHQSAQYLKNSSAGHFCSQVVTGDLFQVMTFIKNDLLIAREHQVTIEITG